MSTKNTNTPVDTKLVAAIAVIMSGPHASRVVEGSIRRPDANNPAEAKYGRKVIMDINTLGADGKPDGNTRTVASSDLHQVFHTPEVAKQMRQQAAKDKRAAAKAERDAAKATEEKASKPRKGRKTKTEAAAADLGVE